MDRRKKFEFLVPTLVVGLLVASQAQAIVIPFTEEFTTNAADWRDANGMVDLTWVASGGPDGGSYASTTFNFVSSLSTDTPALFRAHDEYGAAGSSGGAFIGNWVTAPVMTAGVWVRHNAGVPVSFFFRYASPANFPAAVSVLSPPVPSGQWTFLTVPIPDPGFIFEGPFTYPMVFSNIGHLQIGVLVGNDLAGVNQTFTFDIDRVTITNAPGIPAVSTAGMVVLAGGTLIAGSVLAARRRKSSEAKATVS